MKQPRRPTASLLQGNLKPAPLSLTPAVVAKLLGDQPAYGRGIARVPFVAEPTYCRKCGQTRRTRCTYSTCPIGEAVDV